MLIDKLMNISIIGYGSQAKRIIKILKKNNFFIDLIYKPTFDKCMEYLLKNLIM